MNQEIGVIYSQELDEKDKMEQKLQRMKNNKHKPTSMSSDKRVPYSGHFLPKPAINLHHPPSLKQIPITSYKSHLNRNILPPTSIKKYNLNPCTYSFY